MPKRGENIHKRKDGRWEGRYICGRRADGKAIYRSVYGRSYYETRDKLNEAKSNLATEQRKTVISNKNISEEKTAEKHKGNNVFFYTVCTAWLEMKQKTVRPSTLQKYRLLCEKHIIPELGGIKCSKISTEVLNRFMNVITEKSVLYVIKQENDSRTVI